MFYKVLCCLTDSIGIYRLSCCYSSICRRRLRESYCFLQLYNTLINIAYVLQPCASRNCVTCFRVKKINDGVAHAAKIYPNGYLIMLIIGTIKGEVSPGGALLLVLLPRQYFYWIYLKCSLCLDTNHFMGEISTGKYTTK